VLIFTVSLAAIIYYLLPSANRRPAIVDIRPIPGNPEITTQPSLVRERVNNTEPAPALPLATVGAFPALYLSGRPIGVSALIGFLMLIGLVVTNAIVLLDLVERLRSEGHSTKDALIEGGRTRVRPILMTAIATILALIPLAAGFNQGSIIAAELGTVVIGGLFSATFLTLVVIPVVYSLVDGLKVRVSRRLDRSGASEVPPEPATV
jgi:predicted RND superfamily exporter protein